MKSFSSERSANYTNAYATTRVVIGEPLYETKQKLSLSVEKTAAFTLMATLVASGAATAVEAFGDNETPGIHTTMSTRHEVTNEAALDQSTVTTLEDGTELYIPAAPDTGTVDYLELDKKSLQDSAISIGFGLELYGATEHAVSSMNGALSVLRAPGEDELKIESVVEQANAVALSEEQNNELQNVATDAGLTTPELIAAYSEGKLSNNKQAVKAIESLLVRNQNQVFNVEMTFDASPITATLYELEDSYTLVAERTMKTEEKGGDFPIVVIPIPVPWLRRRTYYTKTPNSYRTLTSNTISYSSFVHTTNAYTGTGGEGGESSAKYKLSKAGEFQQLPPHSPFNALRGPLLKNGAFWGSTSTYTPTQTTHEAAEVVQETPNEEMPVLPTLEFEEIDHEDEGKLATVTDVVPEQADTTETAQTTEAPENLPKEEVEEDGKQKRRRLRMSHWVIATVAGSSLLIPISLPSSNSNSDESAPASTTSSSPSPSPQETDPTSNSPSESSQSSAAEASRPITPYEFIYNSLSGVALSGQSLATVNGITESLTTAGIPQNTYVRDRIHQTKQSTPELAVPPNK